MSIWGTRVAVAGCLAVTVCCLTIGCGPSAGAAKSGEESQARMKTLALLYNEFVASNGGRLPEDEAQLKSFIRKKGGRSAAGGTVGNPDDLFVSARDKQPLVIKYAQKSASTAPLARDTIVAYENTGVGGRRLVAVPSGGVAELDEESFATAMSGQTSNSK